MSRALNKRIADAFSRIYDRGDAGLDYMDRHIAMDHALMEYFYNDEMELLSKLQLTMMANNLETVVYDMEMYLETC